MHIVLLESDQVHALVIMQWGSSPVSGSTITLVSSDRYTPCLGMLPVYVAGYYLRNQVHINLENLWLWVGVQFIEATATSVDADRQLIVTDSANDINYDVLSLDTCSVPDTRTVPGASDFSVPVTLVHFFEEKWLALQKRMVQYQTSIGLVGAKAVGLVLLLAVENFMRHRLVAVALAWYLRSRPDRTPSRGRADLIDFATGRWSARKNLDWTSPLFHEQSRLARY